ncbi:MAG: M28 family metallopeptidase [Enterococcus aquimarinus]|uniref:Carboxypeptidase Q n=1 Tax=Enterococcus aquimarinus TaxID=328396 RepID=A0A9E3ZUR1_9ENTE|nr:M28 family metallopeptidase [Enterococcus aquimarinus]
MENLALLEKLSFERIAGSKEEYRAAMIIKEEIEKMGLNATLEPFEIEFPEEVTATFEITAPQNQSFEVTGVGMAGVTKGLEAPFYYGQDLDEISLSQMKGKIVLFNGALRYDSYKKIIQAGAVGFITFNGSVYDTEIEVEDRYLRPKLQELGKIPGVTMSIHDAQTLVRLNPTTVRLTVNAKESTRTSHNLVVTLPGDIEDEIICFSGHYDSVRHSKGVYDNATGALAVLDFLKYFSQKKPKRTLKFLWLGTEERGLIGATQYVKAHQETIDQYKLNINLDMLGVVLGTDIACVTGEEAITHYIDFVAKELNFAIKTSTGVYPSDSTPFADGGVPAITFARGAVVGGAQIHSKKDVIDFISVESFNQTVEFIQAFASRVIEAEVCPIPSTMPKKMLEELDDYLLRKIAE